MAMILSNCSMPSMPSWGPGRCRERFRSRERALNRISFTSEDLPEPDTPVTQVITPRGKRTSMPFRLLARAFFTVIHPVGFRRKSGVGTFRRPERYAPVREAGLFIISSQVPAATISPPLTPAPGPTSTM